MLNFPFQTYILIVLYRFTFRLASKKIKAKKHKTDD